MADFCKQCSEELFGEGFNDFENCVPEGHYYLAICEGCGFNAIMNHKGECVSAECLKKHGDIDHPDPYTLKQ